MLTVRRIAARAITGARPAAARAASAVRAVSVAARSFEGAARPAPALFAKFPATQVGKKACRAGKETARGAAAVAVRRMCSARRSMRRCVRPR